MKVALIVAAVSMVVFATAMYYNKYHKKMVLVTGTNPNQDIKITEVKGTNEAYKLAEEAKENLV